MRKKLGISKPTDSVGVSPLGALNSTQDSLDITLNSISSDIASPKVTMNGLRPITPFNGISNVSTTNTATKTPITVSSFSLRQREQERRDQAMDEDSDSDHGNGNQRQHGE